MSGVIGFEIPTIIIAIVFVVHLARSWYSRRHHPNYRVGTRYHCHFYHRLHSCSISKGVVWRWRGGDEIRNTFDEIRHGGVQRRSRTSPCPFRAPRSWERCGRAVCCGEHLSAPYAGSSCRVGILSRTVILFSIRMIEGRTCDAVYIATVICMSNELLNNMLKTKTHRVRTHGRYESR